MYTTSNKCLRGIFHGTRKTPPIFVFYFYFFITLCRDRHLLPITFSCPTKRVPEKWIFCLKRQKKNGRRFSCPVEDGLKFSFVEPYSCVYCCPRVHPDFVIRCIILFESDLGRRTPGRARHMDVEKNICFCRARPSIIVDAMCRECKHTRQPGYFRRWFYDTPGRQANHVRCQHAGVSVSHCSAWQQHARSSTRNHLSCTFKKHSQLQRPGGHRRGAV